MLFSTLEFMLVCPNTLISGWTLFFLNALHLWPKWCKFISRHWRELQGYCRCITRTNKEFVPLCVITWFSKQRAALRNHTADKSHSWEKSSMCFQTLIVFIVSIVTSGSVNGFRIDGMLLETDGYGLYGHLFNLDYSYIYYWLTLILILLINNKTID